jgi:hypothetical protein
MSKARGLADLGGVTTRLDEVGNTDGALSNRNVLLNGGFDVWQRGTSMSNPSGNGIYLADRVQFFGGVRADSLVARSTDVPTGERFKYSMATTATQASGYPFYRQLIEDFTTVVSNAYDWTISFWAKASVPMTIDSDLGDATSKTHSLTTSWQRFTHVVPAGAVFTYSAVDLQGNSAAGTIYITGVQLEIGDTATPFEHRSYSDQLQSCMRYFYKYPDSGDYAHPLNLSSGFRSQFVTFPAIMRVAPTLSNVTGSGSYSPANPDSTSGRVHGAYFQWNNVTSSNFARVDSGFTADAEL